MQTLALSAIHFDPTQNRLLALPSSTSIYSSSSLYDILAHIRIDKSFDSLPDHKGRENLQPLFDSYSPIVLQYYNAWQITDLQKALQDAFDLSVSLLSDTKVDGEHYDFILLHVLTACHALRVILPEIGGEHHLKLLRTWWLYTLSMYITQMRPELHDDSTSGYDLKGRDWNWVYKQALESPGAADVHYVKGMFSSIVPLCLFKFGKFPNQVFLAIRGLREASLYGNRNPTWYLKAAVKFAEEFDYYGGFGPVDGDMIDQLTQMMGSQNSVTVER